MSKKGLLLVGHGSSLPYNKQLVEDTARLVSQKDPGYIARKKAIIWCFSAREFTESAGWSVVPVVPPKK